MAGLRHTVQSRLGRLRSSVQGYYERAQDALEARYDGKTVLRLVGVACILTVVLTAVLEGSRGCSVRYRAVDTKEDPAHPLYHWGPRWDDDLANVTSFVNDSRPVLFLGRAYEGSFWVRGVELGDGLRMWAGMAVEHMTFDDFDAKGAARKGGFGFIIFTKFYEFKFSLLRARAATRHLIYDSVDNFWGVPRCADAVLVNTRAQRAFYEYMNVTAPIFVLPHHVGNHNGFLVRAPNPVRSRVLLDPRVPRAIVRDLQHRAGLRGKNVTFGSLEWKGSVGSATNAFTRSMVYSLETATYDLALRWVGYTHVEFCFKPGHRLANALSLGIPTVTDASEGFLETLDDAGILSSYPLIAEEVGHASALAERVLRSDSMWNKASSLARAVIEPFSVQSISWRLFDILYALEEGTARAHANEQRKPILMDYCMPEQVIKHYATAGMTFEFYDELPDRTKSRQRLI